ncbi:MAG TPA: TonB-dependent receptor plug domain-containing protein [Chitinophagaceae bacterium]|jgi:iron complex outermembrane receptor protein|nr:TonB-dependent receptor plug domain-containing protein [Chitinophagaceae bacterium]
MKILLLFSSLLLSFASCFAQEEETDSTRTMDEVTVRAFEQNRNLSSSIATVKILDFNSGDRYNKISLVNGFNAVSGVRMEERSPGSYRINIRGSSLRSPFGVRNVKVYWNDIPVTDAGGNTYFNQFAWNNFSHIEIFKGPAASMYGAGTGGLILMQTLSSWKPGISVEYLTGSYGLQNIFVSGRYGKKENTSQLSFAHNEVNGYRTQSRLRKDNFSWVTKFKLSEKQQLTAVVLFTDMFYQTPGALTLAEFNASPKAARPAAGVLPSAEAAKAAIEQLNFTAGFNHFYQITPDFNNQTVFYGSLAEINNPTIRNYERRSEPGFGSRTVFSYTKRMDDFYWKVVAGGEFQHAFFNTLVFKNRDGKPDTLQTNDDITFNVKSYFIQGEIAMEKKWYVTSGVSLNGTRINFSRLSQFPVNTQVRNYRHELAPRISVKKLFTDRFSVTATVSRGFSPPTIAELLPSTGVVSPQLEAEYGWNYELNAGADLFKRKKLRLELTGFYFRLNKALVQRRDSSGADYFVNAGDVDQKGLEFSAIYQGTIKNNSGDYRILFAYTYDHFRYGSFVRSGSDFSGKTVPSVPAHAFSLQGDLRFKNGIYTNLTYYSASKIFLNDANTAFADPYHILGGRLGWKKLFNKKYLVSFYAGADNLLDEIYSLGNDINAAANRFFNTAPRRNYYAGIVLEWDKSPKK